MGKVELSGLLFDIHCPFHNKKHVSLALDVLEDLNASEIVLGGDFMDAYNLSAWGTSPLISREMDLKDEVAECKALLSNIEKRFKKAKLVFLGGNHEYRLERYILRKCPEMFGMVDIPGLLKMDNRRWHYVEYGPYQKYKVLNSSLIARHSPIGGGIHAAYQTTVKACGNVIFGHLHRIAEAQVVAMNGEYHKGISVGTLADIQHEVMQYVTNFHNWQSGFSYVRKWKPRNSVNEYWFSHNIQIINNFCEIDGKVYCAD